MKVEYVLPERERKEIEKCQKHIEEIKQYYIDEYEKTSVSMARIR